MHEEGSFRTQTLLGFLCFWSWDAWCVLVLGWILLESSWATFTAEEVSLTLIVGEHLGLGSLGNVDLV